MRVRNKTIPFRVTEKELEIIDKKAAKAKLSRTDFLIAAALGKEITLMVDLKPILYELRRIGNNVNQIAHWANSKGYASKSEIHDAAVRVNEAYMMVRDAFR